MSGGSVEAAAARRVYLDVEEHLRAAQPRVGPIARDAARRAVPISTMRPWSITQIRSARCTVESRWAITSVVRLRVKRASASCTRRSDSVSRALVASSSSRIGASFRMARRGPDAGAGRRTAAARRRRSSCRSPAAAP